MDQKYNKLDYFKRTLFEVFMYINLYFYEDVSISKLLGLVIVSKTECRIGEEIGLTL